jgi:hypothetical protein
MKRTNAKNRVIKTTYSGWALVAHSCNPSYSGGRDREDHGSKPAHVNSLRDLISKNSLQKKGW